MAARQRQRLTHRSVTKARPGLHLDGDGLILQVNKSGAKSWILRTMVHHKRRDMGLGGWPMVSLKEAREKAAKFRKIAREHGDPFTERANSNKKIPSFQEAARIVHKANSPSWRNKKHAAQWIKTLEDYVFPKLGGSRVDQIRSVHIINTLSPIWLAKPETARRVLQRIGTVLLWAKGQSFRADSPTDEISGARQGLPNQSGKQKHHKALPHEELPQFVKKLRNANTSDQIKLALEFLILTAGRTGEILGSRWSEIDWNKKTWTIPASRMKAGREHTVPLSERCLEILQEARKLRGDEDEYVFPGAVSGRPLSDMALLMTMRRMGAQITAHGFRSTFRDWCGDKTHYPREVAEAALAHVVKDATEAAYQRSTYFEKRRELMSAWSNYAAMAAAAPSA